MKFHIMSYNIQPRLGTTTPERGSWNFTKFGEGLFAHYDYSFSVSAMNKYKFLLIDYTIHLV